MHGHLPLYYKAWACCAVSVQTHLWCCILPAGQHLLQLQGMCIHRPAAEPRKQHTTVLASITTPSTHPSTRESRESLPTHQPTTHNLTNRRTSDPAHQPTCGVASCQQGSTCCSSSACAYTVPLLNPVSSALQCSPALPPPSPSLPRPLSAIVQATLRAVGGLMDAVLRFRGPWRQGARVSSTWGCAETAAADSLAYTSKKLACKSRQG